MSSKSIALFDAHQQRSRMADAEARASKSTLPPPPAGDPLVKLEAQWRRESAKASKHLAKALELQAMIEFLKGEK